MYQFFMDGVLMPVAPPRLRVRIANNNRALTLVNEGEINLLKTPGLTDIDFTCLLPMVPYSFARYQDGFRMPSYFLAELERLKVARQPFTFVVIRTPDSSAARAEIETTMSVSLEDYSIVEDAARNERDMAVEINLKQARPFSTKTITIEPESGESTTTDNRETNTAPQEATYTIVRGDTLWGIAARKLGSGARHGEIFRLNEAVIEEAARRHGRASSSNGHWIFPGTVIRIPPR